MPPLDDNQTHLFSAIGELQALVRSADEKMNEIRQDVRNIRSEQEAIKIQIAELKKENEMRSDTMDRLESAVETVKKDTAHLVALRNKVGGAFFLLTLVAGALYEFSNVIGNWLSAFSSHVSIK